MQHSPVAPAAPVQSAAVVAPPALSEQPIPETREEIAAGNVVASAGPMDVSPENLPTETIAANGSVDTEADAGATAELEPGTDHETDTAVVAEHEAESATAEATPETPVAEATQPSRPSESQRQRREQRPPPPPVRKVVLLNSNEPGEVRVAILENGELAEIFMERKSRMQQAGNVYKGRVVNVEPSLQAAFIDLGTERNGFLHASDVIAKQHMDVLSIETRHENGAPNGQAVPNGEAPSAPNGGAQPNDSQHVVQPGSGQQGVTPILAAPQGGQQMQQNQGQSGKRRRRRRGGRGRSGRGRPQFAAPLVAPGSGAPGSAQVAPENAVTDAVATAPAPAESAPTSTVNSAGTPAEGETSAAAASEGVPQVMSDAPAVLNAAASVEASSATQQSSEAPSPAAVEETSESLQEPDDDAAADEADEPEEDDDVEAETESSAVAAQANNDAQATEAGPAAEASAADDDGDDESDEHADDSTPTPESVVAAPIETQSADVQSIDTEDIETEIDSQDAEVEPAPLSDTEAAAEAELANAEVLAEHPETEIEVEAAPTPGQPQQQRGRDRHRRQGRSGRERPERRYTVQEMLREGQEILVQVAKEGMGQKGPALTMYLSIPGRYLVLMPAVHRLGVSKRIENEEQRRALKDALSELNPPEGMGVIVRTAGTGRSKEELHRDMNYLMRIWDSLKSKAKMVRAPALIYQEGDVVTRVFRDVITEDVSEIIIDDPLTMERAREFLRENSPGSEHKLKLYTDSEPLFHRYGVEQQMQRLFNRKVNLRNGGSIVIEQTEALVAIDVNTGRFRERRTQDETILQTNLEAAREIARQLRLRDIGGLVMIDFIDMEVPEHRRRVERELKAHLARDKARINVLPISTLGVVEMTRQRIRHSLRKTLFERCTFCSGSGHVKSSESLGLEMLREVKSQLKDPAVKRVQVRLHSHAAYAILNLFRKELVRLEEARGVSIEVCGDPSVPLSQIQVSTARAGGEFVLKKVSEVDDYVRNS